jgi:hypothetical protein
MTTNKTNITAVAGGEGVFYSLHSLSFEQFAYERQFRLETDIVYEKENFK